MSILVYKCIFFIFQKKALSLGDFKIDKKEGTNLCSIIEKKDGARIEYALSSFIIFVTNLPYFIAILVFMSSYNLIFLFFLFV